MKKLTLIAAIMAFAGMVATTYAEVQHVRLSGEVRIRGFWTRNLADLGYNIEGNDTLNYVYQRTRVSVEAEFEEHVMVVATLEARGVWGVTELPFPKTPVELDEAYVQFREVFFSPLSASFGRQALNYGNGLIFSSNEGEYRFDAARFVWDQSDQGWVVDFVLGKHSANPTAPNSSSFNTGRDDNFAFLNARYEPSNTFLKNVELYLGYGDGLDFHLWLAGVRGDIAFDNDAMKGLKGWFEFAYEFGDAGWTADDVKAWLLDLGLSYTFTDVTWAPSVWVSYTLAKGDRDGSDGNHTWVPWYDYNVRGGTVLSPILSNIHIIGFGINTTPAEKWVVGVNGYWYRQDKRAFLATAGNPFVDNGGILFPTNGVNRNLGWEFDFVASYNYSRDIKTNLIFGWFNPGKAFDWEGMKAKDAVELRGEILVNF